MGREESRSLRLPLRIALGDLRGDSTRAGEREITAHDDVAELRIDLEAEAAAAEARGRDQGRAAAEERIPDHVAGLGGVADRALGERQGLLRWMAVRPRAVSVLAPQSGFSFRPEPGVACALLPAVEAELRLLVVIAETERGRLLSPCEHRGNVEAARDEQVAHQAELAVAVPAVEGGTGAQRRGHLVAHALEPRRVLRGRQIVVDQAVARRATCAARERRAVLLVREALAPGGVVADAVRRIGVHQVRTLAAEHAADVGGARGVAAQQLVLAVAPELDEVAGLCDHGRCVLQRRIEVEGFLVRVEWLQPFEQLLDLRHLEAGDLQVQLGRLDQLVEQGREFVLVPAPGDFVEGEVEGLFLRQGQVYDHARGVRFAAGEQHLQALVAGDQSLRAAVPDQRLDQAELVEGLRQRYIARVVGGERDAGVVVGGDKVAEAEAADQHAGRRSSDLDLVIARSSALESCLNVTARYRHKRYRCKERYNPVVSLGSASLR